MVRAYVELCYEVGADNITIQKIADRAKVAFGTVRYYFANEEKALHDEAIKLVLTHSYQVIEEIFFELRRKSTFDPIDAYVDTMFQWIAEHPDEGAFLIYFYYLSATRLGLGMRASETVDKARLRVEGLLHEAVGKGLYEPVVNAAETAATIHALTIGFGFIALTFSDHKQFNVQREFCRRSVKQLLRPRQAQSMA